MVEDKNICDINHVKSILEYLHKYVSAYEEQIGELPEYESEEITFQLAEIDGFIIGSQKCNNTNFAMGDIRLMMYWKYIDGKCSFSELMGSLKKYEGEV